MPPPPSSRRQQADPHPKLALARTHFHSGEVDRARAVLVRYVAQAPGDVQALLLLASCLAHLGQTAQACYYAERAASADPRGAVARAAVARFCVLDGRLGAAVVAADAALGLDPNLIEAHETAVGALLRDGRFHAGLERARVGLKIDPEHVPLRTFLVNALLNCGRAEEAVAALRELLRERGDDPVVCDLLCNALNYDPGVDAAYVREIHLLYGRVLRRHRPDPLPPAEIDWSPGRRLRVGILSPDLKAHSVAYFIEPFFAHHDRAGIELYAYHTNLQTDAVTARLRSHAAAFRHEYSRSDQDLAGLIRADRIDVLMELSGHTQGESLVACHLRPAPVQITYLGYPNTTGLTAMDYRIVDSATDPPGGPADAACTETLVRLDPSFLCFQPPADAPAVVEPPCVARGGVTFGSCNALQKINARVIDVWARVLAAVPGSRLVLKATNLSEVALREDVRGRFVARGVDADRLQLLGPVSPHAAHLAGYGQIDIALDPFPYNGTTTTCDALWMGVPVVTLAGKVHAGRVGVSILRALGRGEWVAEDEDSYIALAAGLAAEPGRLREIRATLRGAMAASPLCDGPGFCRRMETAVRECWVAAGSRQGR